MLLLVDNHIQLNHLHLYTLEQNEDELTVIHSIQVPKL